MARLKILLVEDDHLQADTIRRTLEREFPDCEIDGIKTEHEFRSRLDKTAADPPDVVVMDVMLPWVARGTDPIPEPPREVKEKRHYEAGLRCQRVLETRESTREVPVILYTVLDKEDFESVEPRSRAGVEHLSKGTDPRFLIDKIRELTQNRDA